MPLITFVGFPVNLIFADNAFRDAFELRVLYRIRDVTTYIQTSVGDAMLRKRQIPNAMGRAKKLVCFFRMYVETYR